MRYLPFVLVAILLIVVAEGCNTEPQPNIPELEPAEIIETPLGEPDVEELPVPTE